jgi:hypothetical protein
LKAHGFKKRALTFHRRMGDNFAVLQFQKRRTSTSASVEFTINVGVFSGRVQRALALSTWVPDFADAPNEPECHLRERIGLLMPERQDTWWAVRHDTNPSELGAKLRAVLETHALPFLAARTSDEGLRDHWRAQPARARGRAPACHPPSGDWSPRRAGAPPRAPSPRGAPCRNCLRRSARQTRRAPPLVTAPPVQRASPGGGQRGERRRSPRRSRGRISRRGAERASAASESRRSDAPEEPPSGLEPETYGLRNRCSTTELGWPTACEAGFSSAVRARLHREPSRRKVIGPRRSAPCPFVDLSNGGKRP